MSIPKKIVELRQAIRQRKPLVHHITNYVVMNQTANVTLCIGASPVMAHGLDEVEEMAGFAGALVLNIGTLTPDWVEAMLLAGRVAGKRGIPIVLDPVGAGATRLRTESARRILGEVKVTVLRGNPGEVLSLGGQGGAVKGVDSLAGWEEAAEAASALARELKLIVAMTGKTDVITDGARRWLIDNGHPLLGAITGSGCSVTTAVGCFLAAENSLEATAAGAAYYALAGEIAAEVAAAPGSFETALRDRLYDLSDERILQSVKARLA